MRLVLYVSRSDSRGISDDESRMWFGFSSGMYGEKPEKKSLLLLLELPIEALGSEKSESPTTKLNWKEVSVLTE